MCTKEEISEDMMKKEFREAEGKREKLYFREDGFVVVDQVFPSIVRGSSYLPDRYYESFKKAVIYYKKHSKNYLDFALHQITIWNPEAKGVFVKILNEKVDIESYREDFKIFDTKSRTLVTLVVS